MHARRANGIFNVTRTWEIGTFIISYGAATYETDGRRRTEKSWWERGRDGERATPERKGREQGNNEKQGNREWRWKSRMKKSVSCTLETTKEERCLRHARAAAAARRLGASKFCELPQNCALCMKKKKKKKKVQYAYASIRVLVRHFCFREEERSL